MLIHWGLLSNHSQQTPAAWALAAPQYVTNTPAPSTENVEEEIPGEEEVNTPTEEESSSEAEAARPEQAEAPTIGRQLRPRDQLKPPNRLLN